MNHQLDAKQIAFALEKGHQASTGRYTACCPAHDDRNPSFSITQSQDKVLLHCWSGCTQGEVIEALQQRGLWPKQRANVHRASFPSKKEMRAYSYAYEADRARGIPASTKERNRYRRYQNLLCKPFSPAEVAELDAFCRIYSATVRHGEKPTAAEDKTFCAYSKALLSLEVPCEW